MAHYNVQDPQGRMRVIEGPDGASDSEILSQAKKLFGMSGGLPQSDDSKLQQFRDAIANSAVRPNPQAASFDQDISTGNAVLPPEQKAVNALSSVAGGFGMGQMGAQLGFGAVNKAGNALEYLMKLKNAPSHAEALAPVETALEAGNNIALARDTEQAANSATAKALYDKVPQDLKLPLRQTQSAADSIINEIKDLPKSFQSKRILSLTADLQKSGKTSIGTLQTMNSTLKDMARNGEGVEKLFAARLSKALQADLETFSQTPITPPISQGPSLEAQDLRKLWGNTAMDQSGASADVVAPYVKPDTFEPVVAKSMLDNTDVSNNLKKATSYYKDMSNLKNSPVAMALDRAAIESKANVIFKGGRIDDINTAKALLGDKGYADAQGQFYQKLLNSKDVDASLSKYTPEFLHAALGPEKVDALKTIAHFHKLISAAKKVALTTGVAGTVYKVQSVLRH